MVVLWVVAIFAYLIVLQVNLTENRALNKFARSGLLSRVGGEKGMRRLR
jgi:hypothetical protein